MKKIHTLLLVYHVVGQLLGDEVAKILRITHDLVFPRKIPCPGQPECTIGAVSELGDVFWNDYAKQHGLIDKSNVQQSKEDKQIYHGKRQPLNNLSGKTIILVDDGLATDMFFK
jgi:predicted phosphoribosyltransferase